jgi:hypothetical protein
MTDLWANKTQELREVLIRAHKAYMRAAEESKAVITRRSLWYASPEGAQRIAHAAKVERHALDEYLKAILEFNDYVNQKPATA